MSDAAAATKPTQDETVKPRVDPMEAFFEQIGVTMPALYYEDGTRNSMPYPAMIVNAPRGGRSVTLHLFDPKFSRAKRPIRDGIRFIDDPELSDGERMEKGVFDLPPWIRELMFRAKKK